MKFKSLLVPLCISILPLFLAFLNVFDIFDVFFGKGDYPFGSEFFSPFSIYKSKALYVTYYVIFTLLFIVLTILSFKRNWKWFLIVLVIDIVLFCYPIMTNE